MNGFRTSDIVTDPKLLFGRNKEGQALNKLIINLLRGANLQLCGERRYGKTSTLKCLEKSLSQNYNQYIPVFLNFKNHPSIKGSANIFRFIISKCIQSLSIHKMIDDSEIFHNIELFPSTCWEDIYDRLSILKDNRVNSVFSEVVDFYSSHLGKTFILLIDEYEYLFKYSFDNPQAFFQIRSISELPPLIDKKQLQFVVAGSETWEKLGSNIGSPELNTLGAQIIFLPPLNRVDFDEMWDYLTKDMDTGIYEIKKSQSVYDLSGGIPFYSKLIGNELLNSSDIDYTVLLPHFEVGTNKFNEQELGLLKSILIGNSIESSSISQLLINRGYIKSKDGTFLINGSLYKKYLEDKFSNSQFVSGLQHSETIKELVSKIVNKIMVINKTAKSKVKKEVFIPTVDDQSLTIDLLTLCVDEEDMSRLTSALYKILIEKTIHRKKFDLLPTGFKLDHPSALIIDQARHHFGAHLTTVPTFNSKLSKEDLLIEMTGSVNEPEKNDFIVIQIRLLEIFNNYLNDLNKFIRANASW
ncbi:MAG: hypothetical protein KAS71_09740 [Bacteroidales bacterium]|nr:hypothetical protein [Bacteroidales bacterium]